MGSLHSHTQAQMSGAQDIIICPYCSQGNLKGQAGLSVHISKSPSCKHAQEQMARIHVHNLNQAGLQASNVLLLNLCMICSHLNLIITVWFIRLAVPKLCQCQEMCLELQLRNCLPLPLKHPLHGVTTLDWMQLHTSLWT